MNYLRLFIFLKVQSEVLNMASTMSDFILISQHLFLNLIVKKINKKISGNFTIIIMR